MSLFWDFTRDPSDRLYGVDETGTTTQVAFEAINASSGSLQFSALGLHTNDRNGIAICDVRDRYVDTDATCVLSVTCRVDMNVLDDNTGRPSVLIGFGKPFKNTKLGNVVLFVDPANATQAKLGCVDGSGTIFISEPNGSYSLDYSNELTLKIKRNMTRWELTDSNDNLLEHLETVDTCVPMPFVFAGSSGDYMMPGWEFTFDYAYTQSSVGNGYVKSIRFEWS